MNYFLTNNKTSWSVTCCTMAASLLEMVRNVKLMPSVSLSVSCVTVLFKMGLIIVFMN